MLCLFCYFLPSLSFFLNILSHLLLHVHVHTTTINKVAKVNQIVTYMQLGQSNVHIYFTGTEPPEDDGDFSFSDPAGSSPAVRNEEESQDLFADSQDVGEESQSLFARESQALGEDLESQSLLARQESEDEDQWEEINELDPRDNMSDHHTDNANLSPKSLQSRRFVFNQTARRVRPGTSGQRDEILDSDEDDPPDDRNLPDADLEPVPNGFRRPVPNDEQGEADRVKLT